MEGGRDKTHENLKDIYLFCPLSSSSPFTPLTRVLCLRGAASGDPPHALWGLRSLARGGSATRVRTPGTNRERQRDASPYPLG